MEENMKYLKQESSSYQEDCKFRYLLAPILKLNNVVITTA